MKRSGRTLRPALCERPRSRLPSLRRLYRILREACGPRGWWPAETQLETVIGAVLAQNTAWKNASNALAELTARGWLNLPSLRARQEKEIAAAIRSSGYYNQKARRLKALIHMVDSEAQGSLVNLGFRPTARLRDLLLSVNGIGPETADSILLYAFYRPIFVVDAYTKRLFSRHGYFDDGCTYEEVQDYFMCRLPRDKALYNDFHAQIVHAGSTWCRRNPQCRDCPLGRLPRV